MARFSLLSYIHTHTDTRIYVGHVCVCVWQRPIARPQTVAIYYIYRKHINSVLQLRQLTPRAKAGNRENSVGRVSSNKGVEGVAGAGSTRGLHENNQNPHQTTQNVPKTHFG